MNKLKLFNLFASASLLVLMSNAAQALPSFARQTGESCAACHIGSFGPQLTPHGIKFKLGGYTDYDGKDGHVPLSAMLVGSFTHTSKGQTENAAPHMGKNDNLSLEEISIFLAGRLNEHVGGLVQVTGNDVDRKFAMDNMDVRVVNNTQWAGKDMTYGLSINNNPTIQDPFNTLPGWKFPYMGSELTPGYNATPMLDGGLSQTVLGASAYGFYDNSFYAELGGYQSLSPGALNQLNLQKSQKIIGTAPYWRLAYFSDLKKHAYHVGLYGMQADLQPDYLSSGSTDKYRDIGVDASYQFLGTREHIWTVNSSFVNEKRTFDFTGATNRKSNLNRFDISTTYHYQNTYGASLGFFDVRGTKDEGLYLDTTPDSGSRLASPNTRGYVLQADWTPFGKDESWMSPWANLRLGLQYTGYTKFNGASSNYDGNGRNAKDNNTIFSYAWISF